MSGDQLQPFSLSAQDSTESVTPSPPEPIQNIYRVLTNEPYCYRPHEVDALTPFRAFELVLCKKDKKGMVILDLPTVEEEGPDVGKSIEEDWIREKWKLRGLSGWALDQVVRDEIEKEKRKNKLVKPNGK